MMSVKKSKIKRIGIICSLSIIVLLMTVFISRTYADILKDDVEVQPNSELTYYLNVNYDGIDIEGVKSSDSTVASVNSEILHVEDKLPDGLIFKGFVTTKDGTIGAFRRSDDSIPCYGNVIDNTNDESFDEGTWNEGNTEYTYHGLHYNEETRTVTFDVRNLQAGCVLKVGIVTKVPPVDDPNTSVVETRRDFYNFATVDDGEFLKRSNTVHSYVGNPNADLFNVTYEYEGNKPENAPEPPEASKYVKNATVAVAASVDVEGYKFSGWESKNDDVEILDNKFTMPNHDVILKGSFTKIDSYKVIYEIDGTVPENYVVPYEKDYYPNSSVTIDSMKSGDEFNGYRFSGWEVQEGIDVIENETFKMPSHDVKIVGRFEEIKYKVSYEFYDGVLPPESDSLLPVTEEYKPGEKVSLEEVLDEPEGYRFLGWYKEKTFKMPEENVVVYGEWLEQTGVFEPTITKEIIDKKDTYEIGDIVKYKIVVTNTADYSIRDVYVSENNEKAVFISGDGYKLETNRVVGIESIDSKNSVIIYAEYEVTEDDAGTIINEVEIVGALADNNYTLNHDEEYKATAEFNVKQDEQNVLDKNDNNSDNPNTLDNVFKYVLIAIISLVTIIGICILIKKRNSCITI